MRRRRSLVISLGDLGTKLAIRSMTGCGRSMSAIGPETPAPRPIATALCSRLRSGACRCTTTYAAAPARSATAANVATTVAMSSGDIIST
ncbi:MAG: hypothetical protein DMF96_15935 [Acidobacteria bacterium]|nr:MAG: hypothetical protein DMF96_15935 [Acidobacteriota bacterium]